MSISRQNLSIVILTFKSEQVIDKCIKSLDQNIPIIVVENSDNQAFKDSFFSLNEKIRGRLPSALILTPQTS